MLNQKLKLKLSQKLSPQQIQLMKLIQLSTQEFEQRLSREVEENPALDTSNDESIEPDNLDDSEFEKDDNPHDDIDVNDYLSDDDTPDYKLKSNNYSEESEKSIPFASGTSFNQYLTAQLHSFSLNKKEQKIAEFIVGSLDPLGYLRRDILDISDDLIFTLGIDADEILIQGILDKIYLLEPPGVGARDLKQCLILQLKRKNKTKTIDLSLKIIEEYFDLFSKKHFEKIKQKLNISNDELKDVVSEIGKLNPKPGEGKFHIDVESVIPDLVILQYENSWKIIVNDSWMPELTLNQEYVSMLDQTDVAIDTKKYLKEKFNSANWFIDAIEQRRKTLVSVMKAIINRQSSFFKDGTGDIRPMKLQDIANDIQMDISTISRSTRGKYVDTPFGIYELKSFFSEGYTLDSGDTISTKTIKQLLKELIENENKNSPLTDTDLAKQLKSKGYPVARRTVAKYRENLQFPIAKLRRELIH